MALHDTKDARQMRSRRGTDNTAIGDEGERWFLGQLPRGWFWQPPRIDLGKDGLIVVRDGSDLHNLEFAIQVKASEQPTVSNGNVVRYGVSRSSVQYWFASPLPTLVVAVDTVRRCGWYSWHLDLFDSPSEVFGGDGDTVTLRIPESNRLDSDGWKKIREELKKHFRGLQDILVEAHTASKVFPAVNVIATAVGNLIKIARTPVSHGPPSKDEGMTILIEQIQHRDILSSVSSILRRIDPQTEAHKQIQFCMEAYENIVLSAFPNLKKLPKDNNIPGDYEVAYAPKPLTNTRGRMIDAALDMIRLLTKPYPNQDA